MTRIDTVVAVATAAGEGAVGIVRLTGPRALEIVERMFSSRSGRPLGEHAPRQLVLGSLAAGERGDMLDEVLAVFMPGPRSFTGEDVVELHAHGSPFILESIVQAALAGGAAPAGPGEFTRRAFLNGRLDLAQAEAVIDLIRARGEAPREAALRQLDGDVSRTIAVIDSHLLELSVPLEAALEFGDEEHIDLELDHDLLRETASHLQRLVGRSRKGQAVREGVLIVVTGRTNAGKSSIINRLSGSKRSIVTSEAGTTRDTVESTSEIAGFSVTFVDTAGFGPASGPAEREGMVRSRELLRRADILVAVFDLSRPFAQGDRDLLNEVSGTPCLAVLNKSDLAPRLERDLLAAELPDTPFLDISALTGEGFGEFRCALEDAIHRKWGPLSSGGGLLFNARHGGLLGSALAALARAEENLTSGGPPDLTAAELASARSALGEITGRTVSQDLLDDIFSQFCIGK
jgi:tRNA modification GTPase